MWKRLNYHTGMYFLLMLRRDRLRVTLGLLAVVLLTLVVAEAYTELAATEQERQVMATTMDNPAITAMFGPGHGLDNYTIGAMMGHQMLLFTAVIVAVMSILLMSRNTRGEEERGRVEMIRALSVGRLSNLNAATGIIVGANILLVIILGLTLPWLGIDSIDGEGSWLYGSLLGATGVFFASVTALFAQLAESSRGAAGFSFAFLGLAYLIRALGDVSSETLSWFSPLGWISRSQVYVGNYWWPVVAVLGAALALWLLALYLNSFRDLGSGFVPARTGRKNASLFLRGPLGLALKLQGNGVIVWAIGVLVLGASYGSVMGELETYLETMELMQEMLPSVEGVDLTEQFLPMLMSVISIVCGIPVLLVITRLRGEELKHRTEPIMARAVSRSHILVSYIILSLGLSFILQLLALTGLWLAGDAVMEVPVSLETVFNSGMVYLPALWVMVGVAVLLLGLFPQGMGLVWLYLGFSFLVVYLGELLQLPGWVSSLTPFGYVPQLPVEDMDYWAFFILIVTAFCLMVVGLGGYRKRDLQG